MGPLHYSLEKIAWTSWELTSRNEFNEWPKKILGPGKRFMKCISDRYFQELGKV
jgi:hypothetical protein